MNLGSPKVWDNCGIASITNDAPAQFPVGITIVTWTVTDIHGNTSTSKQKITVIDKVDPSIVSCASPQIVIGNNHCKGVVPDFTGSIVAFDNCTPANQLQITQSPAPGTIVGTGVTTITITVRDLSGNRKTCSTTLTVKDLVAPEITCPADIVESIWGHNCSTKIHVPNPSIHDNCGISSVCWRMSGATYGSSSSWGMNYVGYRNFNVGQTTITYTVKDAFGNTATCSFKVTVKNSRCSYYVIDDDWVNLKTAGNQKGLTVKVKPVPSENFFTLTVQSESSEVIGINVYDVTGRKIQQMRGSVLDSYRFGDIYAAGTYMVEVIQGSERVTTKVIKQ